MGKIRFTEKLHAEGEINLSRGVKVTVRSIVPLAVSVSTERGYSPCHVGRAAGAGKPFGSLGLVVPMGSGYSRDAGDNLQRINVEKALAVKLHTGKYRVVESLFHDISVSSVGTVFKHSRSEKHQSAGSAGLGICGIVWQVVIYRESLAYTR